MYKYAIILSVRKLKILKFQKTKWKPREDNHKEQVASMLERS